MNDDSEDNNDGDVDVDTVEDDFVDKLQVLLLISPGAKDNDVAVPSNDMPCEPANADPVVPVSCDRDAEERERVLADDVEKQFNRCVQEIQTPDPDQFIPITRIRGNKT